MRGRAALAVVGFLVASVGAGAAAPVQAPSPQPIYAAFSLFKRGSLAVTRCGRYRITRGRYTGRATSPDARLAGAVTYVGRVTRTSRSSYGLASGRIVIRDSRRRVRLRGNVVGVISDSNTVNGLVSGRLFVPGEQLLLANVTIVFDQELGFAAVRLGLESGANTAVAYPAVPKC